MSSSLFPSCGGEVRFFQVSQDFFCAFEYGRWNSSQPRHLDAVTLVSSAINDLTQKDHLIIPFPNGHIKIEYPRQTIGQFGQLMVMRGEQCFCAELLMQIFYNGPCKA
ncbi:uncharacterized protein METZ01_LOCUS432660, partial [marine metagenome]